MYIKVLFVSYYLPIQINVPIESEGVSREGSN